jgi:hypothetical protein
MTQKYNLRLYNYLLICYITGHIGEERKVTGFDGKLEGKKPLGRSRHRWEDRIRMDLREIGLGV